MVLIGPMTGIYVLVRGGLPGNSRVRNLVILGASLICTIVGVVMFLLAKLG